MKLLLRFPSRYLAGKGKVRCPPQSPHTNGEHGSPAAASRVIAAEAELLTVHWTAGIAAAPAKAS